jgi:mono/diheme cytochrome c family protein
MKKKITKIVIILLLVLFTGIGVLITYVKLALPNVGKAPELTVERTPERIARGAYLANNVTVCIDCHSSRDWTKFAGPLAAGSVGAGGEIFNKQMGFPGTFYAPNITPFHLKGWTDGELFRAITTGVNKDGRALFPVMPYKSYGKMDKEDIYSIIAYIRTLPEQTKEVPASKADFPVSILINTMPAKATPGTLPAATDKVAYGAYLFTASACADCHTPQDKGAAIKGLENAGGFAFKFPGGTTYSSNITPDKETGIGNWNEEQFVNRFRLFADSAYQPAAVGAEQFQTVMPWSMYGKMKAEDLAAIYAYLQTIKPIKHQVAKFEPAK